MPMKSKSLVPFSLMAISSPIFSAFLFSLISSFNSSSANFCLSFRNLSVLFILAVCTLLNFPLPFEYRQAAAHPFDAFAHTLIPLEFCVCGARYIIADGLLFLIVLAFVVPIASKLPIFIWIYD